MKLKSLLAVLVMVVSANAQAAGEWRVGATTSSFTYSLSTPAVTSLGLSADYGHELSKNLQLIGLGSFAFGGASTIAWNVGAGLRYNFGDKIQESMFIQASIGFGSPSTISTSTGINWKASVGNRWKISEGIAYTPEVGVASLPSYAAGALGTISAVTSIYANLVNFSIWF